MHSGQSLDPSIVRVSHGVVVTPGIALRGPRGVAQLVIVPVRLRRCDVTGLMVVPVRLRRCDVAGFMVVPVRLPGFIHAGVLHSVLRHARASVGSCRGTHMRRMSGRIARRLLHAVDTRGVVIVSVVPRGRSPVRHIAQSGEGCDGEDGCACCSIAIYRPSVGVPEDREAVGVVTGIGPGYAGADPTGCAV